MIRVSDLPHSDKIEYLNAEDATVAHVTSIREEAAPAAESYGSSNYGEPEVAKKGKPEDAAKTADAAKKPAAKPAAKK